MKIWRIARWNLPSSAGENSKACFHYVVWFVSLVCDSDL